MSLAAFGVRKPVVVNLLMFAIIGAGLIAGLELRREFFPEQDPENILITLPYPGATPEEVEEALAIKVENALIDLDELDEVSATLGEGGGTLTAEVREGADPYDALDEVERAIDALQDLPDEAEDLTVQLLEPRLPVIRVALFGDLSEDVLKDAIRALRDDLLSLPGMGEILIDGVRDYEVRIDVRHGELLRQGISLPEVAAAVEAWMTEVPGGTVRNVGGNIKVRTMGVPERAQAIRNIVVRGDPTGQAVTVGDIATVREGFTDNQVINRFNRRPAAVLTVFKVGQQDIVNIAKMVRSYVHGRRGEPFDGGWLDRRFASDRLAAYELGRASPHPLPPGAEVASLSDLARFVEGRLDLLVRNAGYGAVLVFATLLLVLNWRAAFWVGIGLVIAIMGTLALMAAIDVTLNLLTMFGLIVVLGLLVDDAIVVSENIQARHERGEPALEAAIGGTNMVTWPVVATVLTSVVAFIPLRFVKGSIGDLLGALPLVVGCALLVSLVESLFILPSHMAHSLKKRDDAVAAALDAERRGRPINRSWVQRFEAGRDHVIQRRMIPAFARGLAFTLRHRYLTALFTVVVLAISLGLVAGKRVGFVFLSNSDAETVIVDLRMPIGTPIEATERAVDAVEAAAAAQPEVKSIASVVGQSANIDTGTSSAVTTHIAQMFVELYYVELRERESSQVIASIREALEGELVGVDRLAFSEISGGPGGPDITVRISGARPERLRAAVADLKRELAGFGGVVGIADDSDLGQAEQRIVPRPADVRSVGLTPRDVATQVRGFLFGIDAHTFADRQEDIDVRVRLDENTRRDLAAIEESWLVTPAGSLVPLGEVADIEEATTYATITRIDRRRSVTVTADTVPSVSPEDITQALDLDALRAKYPDLSIVYAGRQEQLGDAFASLPLGMAAACAMIYVILAWLFSSYTQPLIVMLVIPFSLIGVVWGHLLLGYDITFLSLIGLVALSGIVVNDSLILVEFYNDERRRGATVYDALIAAGRARFRAILLTTVTTVLGLTPLILEQSFQAKFLIPMAISIAMGLVSATVLILVVLPCFILIFDDIKALWFRLWHGRQRESTAEVRSA